MSYVPPHLRNSSSSTTTSTSKPSPAVSIIGSDCTKLSYTSDTSSNGFRRSSGTLPPSLKALVVPDTVFPLWKPSQRVLNMKPEQVPNNFTHCNLVIFFSGILAKLLLLAFLFEFSLLGFFLCFFRISRTAFAIFF